MPTNITTPFFKPGADITGRVGPDAPVKGKHFVVPVAGGRGGQPWIGPAGAGSYPMGVAGHDQVVGDYVHVNVGGVVPVVTGGDVVAGAAVAVGAGGTAVTAGAGAQVVGLAIASAANGQAVPVHLNL